MIVDARCGGAIIHYRDDSDAVVRRPHGKKTLQIICILLSISIDRSSLGILRISIFLIFARLFLSIVFLILIFVESTKKEAKYMFLSSMFAA